MGYALKSFERLDPDKQDRIIRAALKEFGEQGYDRASTNRIVQDAGIGKGMLFYYFNSKKELYWHLVDFSLEAVQREFLGKIDDSIDDVIDRLAHISRVKWRFFTDHPEISRFLRSEEHTSELQSRENIVCRLLLEKKNYDCLQQCF